MTDTPTVPLLVPIQPCPFCGGAPYVMEDDSYGNSMVGCNCEHEPAVLRDERRVAEAIAAWNKRPSPPPAPPSCMVDDEDERGFTPSDYAHTAELLRSSEPVRKAAASNNHNIILAALDRCSVNPSPPPVLSNWREIREECARALQGDFDLYQAYSRETWRPKDERELMLRHAATVWECQRRIRALPAPPGAGGEEDRSALSDRGSRSDEHSTLTVALTKAAEQFEFYAEEHHSKVVISLFNGLRSAAEASEEKEITNRKMAQMCRAAITAYQKATGGEPRGKATSEHPSAEDGGAG